MNIAKEVVEALRATNGCAWLYPKVFVSLMTTCVNCDTTEALRLPTSVKRGLVGAPDTRRQNISGKVDLT